MKDLALQPEQKKMSPPNTVFPF